MSHKRHIDSGDDFLRHLSAIGQEDAEGLVNAQKSYGNSWKQRGGVGAFMMLARKWDRMENRVKRSSVSVPQGPGEPAQMELVDSYDVFNHILLDPRAEGVIDDVRDLRRYLMLVEAELRAGGFDATHRDNKR
jgi:hypothetical protein